MYFHKKSKMKKITLLILYVFCQFFLFCQYNVNKNFSGQRISVQEINSSKKPWTSDIANEYPEKFNFVVVTDKTGGSRRGVWESGVNKINLMQPEFVVSVGDLIQGYTKNKNKIEKQWADFNNTISCLQMPFFYVAGNHDYTNEMMGEKWKELYGPTYYYFTYKNVLFLCLNSESGYTKLKNPDIDSKQVDFVDSVLNLHPNVAWTMVFMHQPLWLNKSGKNWLKVENLLNNRKHSVFTGHRHKYSLYERNKNDYFVLATMGGNSMLRGKEYGEFDHFLWISMTKNGPSYTNLMLDGIENKSLGQ